MFLVSFVFKNLWTLNADSSQKAEHKYYVLTKFKHTLGLQIIGNSHYSITQLSCSAHKYAKKNLFLRVFSWDKLSMYITRSLFINFGDNRSLEHFTANCIRSKSYLLVSKMSKFNPFLCNIQHIWIHVHIVQSKNYF